MARRPAGRVTETNVAIAVLRIAEQRADGLATFARIKKDAPALLNLSAADQRQSDTRPNEEVWEQLIRNIKSHYEAEGNFIAEGYLVHVPRAGYRITDAGRAHLRNLGY